MNKFEDILTTLQNTVPKVDLERSRYYYISEQKPHVSLRISRPSSFDNYGDILARVTLLNRDKIVLDNLITYNTDLEKFFEKVARKIELCR